MWMPIPDVMQFLTPVTAHFSGTKALVLSLIPWPLFFPNIVTSFMDDPLSETSGCEYFFVEELL